MKFFCTKRGKKSVRIRNEKGEKERKLKMWWRIWKEERNWKRKRKRGKRV